MDSNQIAERHWQLWAERRGVSYDLIASRHHGRPTAQTMQELAPHLNIADEARQKENAEADDTLGLVAFPGAHRILSALPPERWAIVTSGTRRTATTRLRHTLLPTPRCLITADDVVHGKPDPEPYRKAMQQLGMHPSRCVVFEDAPAGIKAGVAAGATVIGITTTNPAALLGEAACIISCLDEIEVQVVRNQIRVSVRSFPELDAS